jgi:hypothetical protein
VDYFDPKFPVVIGGLNPQEDNVGLVQVKNFQRFFFVLFFHVKIFTVIFSRFELKNIAGTRKF